jgi:hypothetical protein
VSKYLRVWPSVYIFGFSFPWKKKKKKTSYIYLFLDCRVVENLGKTETRICKIYRVGGFKNFTTKSEETIFLNFFCMKCIL